MTVPALPSRELASATAWAERLARRLIRDGLSWAKRFASHNARIDSAGLENVFRETVTFAAFLVVSRAPEARLTGSKARLERLSAVLRHEYDFACARIRTRPSTPSPPAGAEGALAQAIAHYSTGRQDDSWMTERRYARFCEVTGMHSTALTGHGPNLAQIFFYLRIFAVIDGDDQMTLEERKRLLRAAQDCREHFVALSKRLLADGSVSPSLATSAPVARQTGSASRQPSRISNRSPIRKIR
jgi:hypothetical protein